MPLPNVPTDILDTIRDLQTQVRELSGRVAQRPAQTQIAGGDVAVYAGGSFRMLSVDGSLVQTWIGKISPNHPDGSEQRGILMYREDGSLAFSLYSADSNPQAIALRDKTGNTVVADDVVAGGLALPYLPIPFAPARYTDWLATTAAAFEDVHRATVTKLQPYAYVVVAHTSDTSGTTGELQVTVNGTPVGSPTGVGFVQSAVTIGPFALPGTYRSQVEIRVQARRTAGTGNVRCHVVAASGIQS